MDSDDPVVARVYQIIVSLSVAQSKAQVIVLQYYGGELQNYSEFQHVQYYTG